jgi:hypothetical protein
MSITITYLAAQEHVNNVRREAQRPSQLRKAQHDDLLLEVQNNRDHVKVRRVAVIQPAGSHFALMPTLGSLDARRR